MDGEYQDSGNGHGGLRAGAGRPKGQGNYGQRMSARVMMERLARLQALGIVQGTARRVLEAMGGDAYWLTIFDRLEEQGDWSKISSLVQFLLQMRDGRPAQQINITSQSISFTAEELDRARQVARELGAARTVVRGELANGDEATSGDVVTREEKAKHAFGEQGEKKDGI